MKPKARDRRMPSSKSGKDAKKKAAKAGGGKRVTTRKRRKGKSKGGRIYHLKPKRPTQVVPGVIEAAAIRRNKALELRIEGLTYAEIAKALECAEKTAWEYVNLELQRLGQETAEKTEQLRALELGRIAVRERKMTTREIHWERLALRGLGDAQSAGELTAEWLALNAESVSLSIRAESALCKLAEQRTKLAARRAELQGLDEPMKLEMSGHLDRDAWKKQVAEAVAREARGGA